MSAWAKGAYFFRTAAHGLVRTPFVHAVAVGTIALSLFALGAARWTYAGVQTLLSSVGGQVQLTVYLAPERGEAEAALTAQAIQDRTGQTPRVVSPEQALERLTDQLGELGGVLADLNANPLPYTVELAVPEPLRAPEALEGLAKELHGLAGVVGVDYGREAVERLSLLARAMRVGGLVGFAAVLLATALIVGATLQLSIYARRTEVEIQKLVGATDAFVKVPFVLEGVLQGLFGAALAVGALALLGAAVGPSLASLLTFFSGGEGAKLSASRVALELAAAGATLGLAGSFIAVGRFLRV